MTYTAITETYLTKACQEIRNILEANEYIIDKCQDTLKDPDDPFILNESLKTKHLVRNYSCSVHHTCKEVVTESRNLQDQIIGVIYIDFHVKKNKTTGNSKDLLEIFGRNILNILRGNLTFNDSVEGWDFKEKSLWPVNDPDKPDEKIIDWVGSITLHLYYTENFHYYIDG